LEHRGGGDKYDGNGFIIEGDAGDGGAVLNM